MIDHISTYATDFAATKSFYQAALESLGYGLQADMVASWDPEFPERRLCAFGPPQKAVFWIIEVKAPASPRHVAFAAADRDSVARFHARALAAGGTDNGAPGPRPQYHKHYFGAFVLDPDGNNVEAVCHVPPAAASA
ncbi:MAG: VOC family protein [Candidatus Schekmanbacteria bacterium]|nr:VOC family protein [Candidatus Schekmanbacteria bacterium]